MPLMPAATTDTDVPVVADRNSDPNFREEKSDADVFPCEAQLSEIEAELRRQLEELGGADSPPPAGV